MSLSVKIKPTMYNNKSPYVLYTFSDILPACYLISPSIQSMGLVAGIKDVSIVLH